VWKSIRTDRRVVAAVLAAALACAFLATPTASELQRFEAVEPHMGTLVRITVYAPDIDTARHAIGRGFDRIRELDALLSDYRADSELSQLATQAVAAPVRVSADVFAVLEVAQQLAEQTDGAFDITLGPVVRLWREARRTGVLPDAEALTDARTRTGWKKLHLDPAARTVRLAAPGMALDVGAIGKGYAATEALRAIEATGVSSALVAISGDLAFGAAPPGRRGWRVALSAVPASADDVPRVLELTHAAVSTSGNEAQHLDVDGRRYSHVVDPASGMGLVDDVTVTVIAPHGVLADGLDTAMSVLGPERGLALIERHPDAAGLLVVRSKEAISLHVSTRLRALVAAQPGRPGADGPQPVRSGSLGGPLVEDREQVEVRRQQADVTMAREDANRGARHAGGHEPCLVDRGHEAIAVGGEEERGRREAGQLVPDVVAAQHREAREVAVPRRVPHQHVVPSHVLRRRVR
jgi:thiamine biosynthesis lipoprotein